jgi:hypothetical protein
VIACGSETNVPAQDIVTTIPWHAPEELDYTLVDNNGNEQATGVHTIEQKGDTFVFTTRYESPNGNSDTTSVTVDATTLKPISSDREIDNDNPNDESHIAVDYTDQGVLISIDNGDKQSGLTLKDHSYDNDSSLFLWRTIDFKEGYESSYYTVITNRRSEQRVVLRVTGKESVTVPAGTFDAWRLEILTTNARQTAWYADTPERPLVKYDNDRGTIFELTSAP